MISVSISTKRIDKSLLIPSKKDDGKYLSMTLHDGKHGQDQYGNDGFVAQNGTKEQGDALKKAGKYSPIIGNWRHVGTKAAAPQAAAKLPQPSDGPSDDDILF